jgi:phosphopantothenate synthetase
MENKDVAKILRETAHLLEIDGAIIGRYRSYEKVAELLENIPERIDELATDDKKLKALPALGSVRAKTGNLGTVTALVGLVTDKDGTTLAFAFMADRIPAAGMLRAAAIAIDEAAAALANCGCR